MVEFLKYWLHNCSVGFHFGGGVFSYISAICAFVSAGLFLLKKCYRRKWKRWEQIIMRTAFCLFIISFLIAAIFVAPFLKNRSNEQEINKLQTKLDMAQKKASESESTLAIVQKQIPNTDTINTKPVTKQELRTFLEDINREILQGIDSRKDMHVLMGIPTQIRLIELSKRPDFDKFLYIQKSGAHCIGNMPEVGLIKEVGETGYMDGYYLVPKDALIK